VLKKWSTIGYSAALVTMPAWMSACGPTGEPEATPENPEVLFSVSSDAIRFENPRGDEVTLVMENVDPYTVWFADRPTRESGAFTTEELVADWNVGAGFDTDPPNAALVLHVPNKDEKGNITETIVATVLDASYDKDAAELRAELRVMTEEEAGKIEGSLENHAERHDFGLPQAAGSASLFIDPIVLCSNPSTCNNHTTQNYTYNSTIYFQTDITTPVTMEMPAPVWQSESSAERF
jgi:hypothetical protein